MKLRLRLAAALAAPALALGGGAAIAAAGPAAATTLTCTNIATAVFSPFGCGGLQSAGTVHGTLDLAHTSNVYNAFVTVQPDASVTSTDWTAFAVGGKTTGGVGGLGAYVAMDTPDGLVPDFTVLTPGSCATGTQPAGTYTNAVPCAGAVFTADAGTLCLSVEHVVAVNGKLRWWNVLRTCNDDGDFTYGTSTTTGSVSFGLANQYQSWAPVIRESAGYLLVNVWLHNHSNVNYVEDITGNGPAGAVVQAFPENDQINEEWGLIGCTLPASHLGGVVTPPYVNCP
jgi:hypothetical protein